MRNMHKWFRGPFTEPESEDDAYSRWRQEMDDNDDWMEEARVIAAQCWCDEATQHLVMEPVLAEAVARRIAAWMRTGAQHARNEAFWREKTDAADAEATKRTAQRCVEICDENRHAGAEAACRAIAKEYDL